MIHGPDMDLPELPCRHCRTRLVEYEHPKYGGLCGACRDTVLEYEYVYEDELQGGDDGQV